MTRRRILAIGAGVLAVLVLFSLMGGDESAAEVEVARAMRRELFRSFVSASGEIVAERYADVGSSIMGRVVDLPVAEGQEVAAGTLLARIDPVQAKSDLDAAEAAIEALEAESRSMRLQVVSGRAELERAQALEREAAARRERQESLAAQGVVPASELDSARAQALSRGAEVEAAKAALARAESAQEAADRRVAQARAQAARARDVYERTFIESPIAGVVSRLQVRQGEMVIVGIQNQPGTVLMTVSDLSELNAEVKVAEADVLRVEVGQEAAVTLEAVPDRTFTGRVTEVGASALPQLTAGAAAREFRVEIRLADPAPGIRPGLTCDAEILVGEARDIVVVPLQAVVIRPGDDGADVSGVFSVDGGEARFVPVETGMIGGLDIQVAGIDESMEIIAGPYQILRELEDGAPVRVRRGGD